MQCSNPKVQIRRDKRGVGIGGFVIEGLVQVVKCTAFFRTGKILTYIYHREETNPEREERKGTSELGGFLSLSSFLHLQDSTNLRLLDAYCSQLSNPLRSVPKG